MYIKMEVKLSPYRVLALLVVAVWLEGVEGFSGAFTTPPNFFTTIPSVLSTPGICPTGTTFCNGVCLEQCAEPPRVQNKCSQEEVFCLASGRCVSKENGCFSTAGPTTESVSSRCSEDQIFCLQVNECVPRQSINCKNDIDSGNGGSTLQGKCGEDETFCLASGRCVPKNGCESENKVEEIQTKCNSDEYFCLQQGRCIKISGDCESETTSPATKTSNCGEDEYFCLQRNGCVPKSGSCGGSDDTTDGQCDLGLVYCGTTQSCIPLGEACGEEMGGGATSHTCMEDQYFCLQSGRCMPKHGGCDGHTDSTSTPAPSTEWRSCGEGQVFCLQSGRCVDKENKCSTPTPHMCDPAQEYYCPTRGECVKYTEPCEGPPSTESPTMDSKCPAHQVFCLASGRCVEKTCSGDGESGAGTPMSTSSPSSAGDRLLLVDRAVTVYNSVQFRLVDYMQHVVQEETKRLEHMTVHLSCDEKSGVEFYAGRSAILEDTRVGMFEQITAITDGSEKTVATCKILSLPTTISMGYQYHIGVVAIPELLTPNITMAMTSVSVNEGITHWTMDQWDKVFLVNITDKAPQIPDEIEILSERGIKEIYEKGLEFMEGGVIYPLRISLKGTPLDSSGLPMVSIVTVSGEGSGWRRAPSWGVELDDLGKRSRSLHVKLHPAFSGDIHFDMRLNSGDQFVFTLKVIDVNNAPYLLSPEKTMDILTSILVQPYTGDREFTAGEISDLVFADEDGDHVGLALLGTASNELGSWHYDNGTGWKQVPLIGPLTISQSQQNVSAVLLTKTDKLKFASSVGYLWTTREALKKTKLYTLAWDGSDMTSNERSLGHIRVHRCSARMKICGSGGHSAYSEEIITLFINKAGCDGRPGSQLGEDLCGVCGGYNDCEDCSGKLNGGAVVDSCGDCTEGDTGLTRDHRLDCRGQCGLNYFDNTFKMCLPNNVDKVRLMTLFQECDGRVNSDAYTNKCGYCVLGNTSRPENHGEDQCGVCEGENECVDCAGVPHGESVLDFCDKCVLRNSKDYNKECYVGMGHINQTRLGANGQKALEMTVYTMAQEEGENRPSALKINGCGLYKGSYFDREIDMTVVSYDNNTGLIIARTRELTAADVGLYRVGCFTTDEGISTINSPKTTRIVLFGAADVRAVIPQQINVQEETKVTVRAIRFYKTDYLMCAIRCPYKERGIGCFSTDHQPSSFMLFPAKLVDDTTCECDLKHMSKVNRPMPYDLTVLFEPLSSTSIPGLQYVKLYVRAPAPRLESAWFNKMYCSLTLMFDASVEGPENCRQLFDEASYQKLGHNAECHFMGNKLMVFLKKGEFSLRPGEQVTISNTSIHKLFSEEREPSFASGSVVVSSPRDKMQISVELVGGGMIGSCDPFDLYLRKSGSLGCVDIVFNWTVASNHSSPSASILSDVASIQTRLDDLPTSQWKIGGPGSEIVPGSTYIFTTMITNMMDLSSTSVNTHVTRSHDLKPISVQLKLMSRKHPDPQRPLKMVAVVTPSACSGIDMQETSFLYKWTSSSADVVISSVMELPFAVIRRGSLRGGSTYTITVTVFKLNDESVSDEASTTFTTLSQPLEVKVPKYIQSLPTATVILDASRSSDPDNAPENPKFFWACAKESVPGVPYYIMKDGSEVMLEALVRPSDPVTPILTIPPDMLSVGRYVWNVTMMKGKRSSSSSVVIEIVDNRAPLVVMETTDLTLNSGEPLRLSSIISTYNKKPVKVFWDCAQVEGYDYMPLDNFTSLPQRLVEESDEPLSNYVFSLYLDQGLPAGGRFLIQVTAIAGESILSRTEQVKVTVNSPPMIGEVKITPLNGSALTTKFTVQMGEGWIDPEGDRVVFYIHTEKVDEGKVRRMSPRPLTDIVSYNMMLETGEFKVHIEACDLQQACVVHTAPDTILVSEKQMTEAELNTAVSDVTMLLKTDMDQAVGMAMSLTSLMEEPGNNSQALGGVMNDVAYSLLSSSSAQFAPEEAVTVIDTANTILQPMAEGGMLTPRVREEGLTKANQLAATVRPQSQQGGQRKRRAVDPNTLTTVTVVQPMSKSTAETILTSYSLLHMGKTEDQITTTQATDFLTALDSIKIGLCAGITYAEDAMVVDSAMTTLRIQKKRTDDLAGELVPVTCLNCTANQTALVLYGAEVADRYHHWNCSTELQCYGACFTSSQISVDMVTATSPHRFSFDMVRRSDLIALQLVNPSTYDLMTPDTLTTPVKIQVPIRGEYNDSDHSLQCNIWTGTNWTIDGCASSIPEFLPSGLHMNCSCNKLGIIGVFEGPVTIETTTTMADTTTGGETTVTTEMTTMPATTNNNAWDFSTFTVARVINERVTELVSNAVIMSTTTRMSTVDDTTTPINSVHVPAYAGKVYILFALHDNFASIVAGQENSFRLHIMQILTSYLKIPASRITNLRVEEVKNDDDDAGSITIKFEVFSRALDSEPTMGEIIFQLREAITTGSLVVTSTTGQRLVVDTNSFAWSTSELQTEIGNGANYTMFIVSGAVGAFVLIIIMTGIFIYLIKTKANKAQQVTQSPTPYGPNMQGVDVPRPMVGKNNVSGNWMENETTEISSSVSDADAYKSYSAKAVSRLPPIQ